MTSTQNLTIGQRVTFTGYRQPTPRYGVLQGLMLNWDGQTIAYIVEDGQIGTIALGVNVKYVTAI